MPLRQALPVRQLCPAALRAGAGHPGQLLFHEYQLCFLRPYHEGGSVLASESVTWPMY